MIALADEFATEDFAAQVATSMRPGDWIALDGELGAGKTSFVRGLARGLGIDPRIVASPTFITMQTYGGGRMPLVHIDVWRLKDLDELESIGWNDLIKSKDRVIVVEWARRIAEQLPAKRLSIQLEFVAPMGDSARTTRNATILDQRDLLA